MADYPVTVVLVAANVILFVASHMVWGLNVFFYQNWTLGAGAVLGNHEYWRVITSIFLHGSLPHLVSNMLILYFVGKDVEERLGSFRYLVLYFASGVVGNVISLYAEWRRAENWVSLGASGAVFGILGALVVLAILQRKYYGDGMIRRIVFGVAYSFFIGLTNPGTNNYAHFGGLISGAVIMLLYGVLSSRLRK